MTSICWPHDVGAGRSSVAFGAEAQKVGEVERAIEDEILSAQIAAHVRRALDGLRATVRDCSVNNWDGYSSRPVNLLAAHHAERLLRALSFGLPAPEVSAHPDGDIVLEWYRAPRRMFEISVSPLGELNYAGLFGRSKVHGRESSIAHGLPETVRSHLQRVYA